MGFFQRQNLKARLDRIMLNSEDLREKFGQSEKNEASQRRCEQHELDVVTAYSTLQYLYIYYTEGKNLREKVRETFAREVEAISLAFAQRNDWDSAETILKGVVRSCCGDHSQMGYLQKVGVLGIPLSEKWRDEMQGAALSAETVPSLYMLNLLSGDEARCDLIVRAITEKESWWALPDFYAQEDRTSSCCLQWVWDRAGKAQAPRVLEQIKKHEALLFNAAADGESLVCLLSQMAKASHPKEQAQDEFRLWFANFCADSRLDGSSYGGEGLEAFHDVEDFLLVKTEQTPPEQQAPLQAALKVLAEKDQQRVTRLVIEDEADTAASILCRRIDLAGFEPEAFGGLTWAGQVERKRRVILALPAMDDEGLPLQIVGFEPSGKEWKTLCLCAGVLGLPVGIEATDQQPNALFEAAYARLPAFPEAFATRLAQVKNKLNTLTK